MDEPMKALHESYTDLYNNSRVSLDYVQSRIDQINQFMDDLGKYKDRSIVNF